MNQYDSYWFILIHRCCTIPVQSCLYIFVISPPARWGLLDFMSDARLLHLVVLLFLPPRRTSSASSWSQWSPPELVCQLLIAVVLAGPHLPALDRSGPRRTSTSESLSAVGLAGLQPARVWALWASQDFNRREFERCGPRGTSTGESLSAMGLAGLQPARVWALWASPDFNRTSTATNKAI